MKRIFIAILAGAMCATINAQVLTLTNTFGGDLDDIASDDMITFSRFAALKDENGKDKTDDDGNVLYDDVFSPKGIAADRLQLDWTSSKLDGRIRLKIQSPALASGGWDTAGSIIDSNDNKLKFNFQGYLLFSPIEYLSFGIGNQYFLKSTISGAYLAATADVPAWGRMIQSGVSIVGRIPVGLTLTGSFSPTGKLDETKNLGFNFAFDWLIAKAVSIGATFQNVTGGGDTNLFTSGAFIGLKAVENLTLNAGFVWNAQKNDFLLASTKTAIQFSAGYNFVNAGCGIYVDLVSGLSDKYINSTGDDANYDDAVPLQAMVRGVIGITDALSLSLEAVVYAMAGDEDTVVQAYPYIKYKLPNNFGTFKAGVRLYFQDKEGTGRDGLQKFSIPVAWEYKVKLVDKK